MAIDLAMHNISVLWDNLTWCIPNNLTGVNNHVYRIESLWLAKNRTCTISYQNTYKNNLTIINNFVYKNVSDFLKKDASIFLSKY